MLQPRRLPRLAVLGVIAAALGLSACGRKGPLDPPPSSYVPQASTQRTDAAPGVPAERKRFLLDFLLN